MPAGLLKLCEVTAIVEVFFVCFTSSADVEELIGFYSVVWHNIRVREVVT